MTPIFSVGLPRVSVLGDLTSGTKVIPKGLRVGLEPVAIGQGVWGIKTTCAMRGSNKWSMLVSFLFSHSLVDASDLVSS